MSGFIGPTAQAGEHKKLTDKRMVPNILFLCDAVDKNEHGAVNWSCNSLVADQVVSVNLTPPKRRAYVNVQWGLTPETL